MKKVIIYFLFVVFGVNIFGVGIGVLIYWFFYVFEGGEVYWYMYYYDVGYVYYYEEVYYVGYYYMYYGAIIFLLDIFSVFD